jgi:hypothetical protein
LPIGNEYGLVHSDGVIGQHSPNQVISDSASTGTMLSAKKVNEPMTETISFSTASRAQVVATAGSNISSHTVTSSGRPAIPPRALMYSW